jgi:hypothetical protein
MKLASVPSLRTEDFGADQQTLTSKLFVQLNPFIQAVNQVLLQNVDFTDNIKSVTKDYNITTFQPFDLTWPFSGINPAELKVIKALKGTDQVPTILMCAWNYDSTTKLITVSRMVELNDTSISTLSGQYIFTIRVSI